MLIYRILRSIWWRSPEPVLTARAQRDRGYFNLFLNIHFSPDAEQNSPFQHLSPPRNFAARRRVLSKYLIDQHFNALARLLGTLCYTLSKCCTRFRNWELCMHLFVWTVQ